ncbi:phosphonate C-P lyase system protein PhnH [Jiella avicenniae]|uniref:Phosphonate C-P lyase system protein PhnH n=1 Tax=Jiella avicenniae TaxID=2907202 RepID=A0A9X1NVM8_9HYPH|nr:phosphonate C-P lyase system protein PhnH [Jiella avicenniae]MCE7026520.1 phosphonate C-P lyase system protein PhnH [Jiella avicenniae]
MVAANPLDLSRRAVAGGFADPVFDAQAVFSAILGALSRPGTIVDTGARASPPAPLSPAQGAALLALGDADTPVHVGDAGETLEAWLGFQTGARLVGAAEARFAVVPCFDRACLETFPLGTLGYPDRSATLLVEVASFGSGEALRLSGPGISGETTVRISGLGNDFVAARRTNRALFPCGLDLVLTCGTEILGLPRTTIVEEA